MFYLSVMRAAGLRYGRRSLHQKSLPSADTWDLGSLGTASDRHEKSCSITATTRRRLWSVAVVHPHATVSSDIYVGATIGSASIDRDFQRLVIQRLESAKDDTVSKASIDALAWEMMKSQDFQNTKCEHGGLDDTPIFSIPLPRVDHDFVDETVGIYNGEMRFTRFVCTRCKKGGCFLTTSRKDLQTLFDRQVQKLIRLIDSQLQALLQKFPGQSVVCR